ncbi:MAG TPA: hypothetical protein VIG99_23065, partial [Myxococcaceae bacterium]
VLAAGGWLAAGYACSTSTGDPTTFNQCASAGSALMPLLLQPRTVKYGCIGTGAATGAAMPVVTPAPVAAASK